MSIFDDVADWVTVAGDRLIPFPALPRAVQACLIVQRAAYDFAESGSAAERAALAAHLRDVADVIASDASLARVLARLRACEGASAWADAPAQGHA